MACSLIVYSLIEIDYEQSLFLAKSVARVEKNTCMHAARNSWSDKHENPHSQT